jgi:hypothetical protein
LAFGRQRIRITRASIGPGAASVTVAVVLAGTENR